MTKAGSTNQVSAADSPLHDIRPPVAIPNVWLWILGIVGGVIVIVAAIMLWRAWRRNRTLAGRAQLTPEQKARLKFREAMSAMSDPKLFAILVSDALRGYLQDRFQLHAPERTTEEFLHELGQGASLQENQKAALGEFLAHCDLIKFAKYDANQAELESLLAVAESFVTESEMAMAQPEPVVGSK